MRKSVLFMVLLSLESSSHEIIAQSATKLEPSAQIEGTYQVIQMTVLSAGQTPQVANFDQLGNKMSAVIIAKRKSQRYVSLTFSQSQNATLMLSFRYGDAYLRTTAKGYDLAINGNKVGKTDGRKLALDISAKDKAGGLTKRSLLLCKKS